MFRLAVILLLGVSAVRSQFPAFPSINQGLFGQDLFQNQGQATGNAAAAGSAGTKGQGSATSINKADQQGTRFNTQASGLSANTAQGDTPTASGATQAQGAAQNAQQVQHMRGKQTKLVPQQTFPMHFPSVGQQEEAQVQGQRLTQATGNAAAAGTAAAQGPGSASSINKADQVAGGGRTASSGLSANIAQGFNPTASGAAQAGGSVQSAEQIKSQMGRFQTFPVGK